MSMDAMQKPDINAFSVIVYTFKSETVLIHTFHSYVLKLHNQFINQSFF
jgi:hypothetical protein